jgi:hypothetical protein
MWNPEDLSVRYRHQAEDAERYLAEVRRKVKGNRSYEHVFDQQVARFYVFNHLHGRTFLESRRISIPISRVSLHNRPEHW